MLWSNLYSKEHSKLKGKMFINNVPKAVRNFLVRDYVTSACHFGICI